MRSRIVRALVLFLGFTAFLAVTRLGLGIFEPTDAWADQVSARAIAWLLDGARQGGITEINCTSCTRSGGRLTIASGGGGGAAALDAGSVGSSLLAAGSVTASKLGDGSVGALAMGANAVGSANIINGSITGDDILDGGIEAWKAAGFPVKRE